MARALLQHVVQNATGDAQGGASVTVYEADGTTLLAASMFSAASGGTTLTNPLTADAYGLVTAYVTTPQRCVVSVSGRTYATEFEPDPSTLLIAGLASIVNADVNAAAAIARSKLNFGSGLVNADIAAAAAIAYSKLALTGGILNADVNASAAIAYSKLALGTSIVNADVATAAAIALSKLAAGSAGFVKSNGTTISAGNSLAAADLAGLAAVQLSATTLGVDTVQVNIINISQAYSSLRLAILGRDTTAATESSCWIRLGTGGSLDTGFNYSYSEIYSTSTTAPVSTPVTGDNDLKVGRIPGASAANAADAGIVTVDIHGYTNTTWRKRTRSSSGCVFNNATNAGHSLSEIVGTWVNTGAVNTMAVYTDTSFKTGTVVVLWGIP
jgi:hypothetical protein